MAFWQFLVLAVLLTAVLVSASVYARVLGRTIGHANARLKRIEEALVVANDRLLRRTAPGAAEPSSAISHKSDRVDDSTVWDLKVGAPQARLQPASAAAGSRRNSLTNSRRSVNGISSRMKPSETIIERMDSVATSTVGEILIRSETPASSDRIRSSNGHSASTT